MNKMTDISPSSVNLNNFKRRAFELCLAIYRVTKLFPTGELLINQLKEASLQIIVLLAQGKFRDTILKAEEMKIYLAVAREQNWLKPINFDLLKSAYSLLADALADWSSIKEIMAERGLEKKVVATPLPLPKKEREPKPVFGEAEKRQKLIIDYFNENKEAKVSELLGILGKVSERTVRNDLASLIGQNFIKKVGNNKNAYYILN